MTEITTLSTKVTRLAIQKIPSLFSDPFMKKLSLYLDAYKYAQDKRALGSSMRIVSAESILEGMSFVRKNCEPHPRTEITRITIDQILDQRLEPVLLVVSGLKLMPYYEVLGNIQCLIGSGKIKGVADIYGVYAMTDAHELVQDVNSTPVQQLLAIGDVFKKKSSDREFFIPLFQKTSKDGFHCFVPVQRNLDILKKGVPFNSGLPVNGSGHTDDENHVSSHGPKEDLSISMGTTILAFREPHSA